MISGSVLLVLGAVGCGVDVDAVEMEVFLNPLFEAVPLLDGEGIGLCDHRDDVHKTVEVLHELHVNGTKAGGGRREGRYQCKRIQQLFYITLKHQVMKAQQFCRY